MNWHQVSPSPFIIILHNTITLHKQLHIQSPSHQLPTVLFTDTRSTCNVVCPRDVSLKNKPHSMPSIRLVQNLKRILVQWVGNGTHTHIYEGQYPHQLRFTEFSSKFLSTVNLVVGLKHSREPISATQWLSYNDSHAHISGTVVIIIISGVMAH